MGDYSVVRKVNERMVGFDSSAALEFNDCLHDLEMDDMPARGFWYTWSNKRGGLSDNKSKLDRAVVNGQWMDDFPESEACFLAPGVSDHCKIMVSILPAVALRRPFEFFSFWMLHASFRDLLSASWSAHVEGQSNMLQLSLKFRRLKPVLRNLNKEHYSHINLRVEQAKSHLDQFQKEFFDNHHDPVLCTLENVALC